MAEYSMLEPVAIMFEGFVTESINRDKIQTTTQLFQQHREFADIISLMFFGKK